MADLAALQVQLELQTAQFTEQMNKVNGQLDKLNNKVDAVSNTFKKLGQAIIAAGAVGIFVNAIRNAVDAMDDLRDSAQKVGVSIESLSQLQFAAKQSGVGIDELNSGLTKLNKNLADVDKGTSDSAKALRIFGVTSKDTTEQALKKIADGFRAIPNGIQKTAAAIAIFGKSGAGLIPLLNEGSAGIEELMKRFDELGGTVTQASADMADKFNDAMGEIDVSINGIVKGITAGLLPALADITAAFSATLSTSENWKLFGEGLGEVLKFIAKAAVEVAGVFQHLGMMIGALGAAVAALLSGSFTKWQGVTEALHEDVENLAKSIEQTKNNIDGMGKSVVQFNTDYQKTAVNTKLLDQLTEGLGDTVDKTTKKVRQYVQLALTPAQKVLIDLNKISSDRAFAMSELDELNKLTPEMLKQLGISAEDLAEAQEKLKKSAGVWTVLDQAMSNVTKHESEVAKMSEAWDKLVAQLTSGEIDAEKFEKAVR
jgi:tetrahydromethanopterin S-methyltransferase subunit G/uncharacterized protein YoxC